MVKKFITRQHLSNERGFVFPFLFFLVSLLLIALTYNIHTYQTSIAMSVYHQENIIYDSLYQMALEDLYRDLNELTWETPHEQLAYHYPSGEVIIKLNKANTYIESIFTIELTEGKDTKRFKMLTLNNQ